MTLVKVTKRLDQVTEKRLNTAENFSSQFIIRTYKNYAKQAILPEHVISMVIKNNMPTIILFKPLKTYAGNVFKKIRQVY